MRKIVKCDSRIISCEDCIFNEENCFEIDKINPYTLKLYEDITNKISIPYTENDNLAEQSQEVEDDRD